MSEPQKFSEPPEKRVQKL